MKKNDDKKGAKESFEKLHEEIEQSVNKIESGELSINEGLDLYEEAVKKVRKAQKILDEAETKIREISASSSEK